MTIRTWYDDKYQLILYSTVLNRRMKWGNHHRFYTSAGNHSSSRTMSPNDDGLHDSGICCNTGNKDCDCLFDGLD
jgi:hypothetical protein